jgi:hypothetical protein
MSNPGPAVVSGNDYLGGGTPQWVGTDLNSLVGFYGATPVAQRATNSIHVTSNVSAYSATTASALIGAWIVEVTNTLVGLGIWTSP